jgi:MscS family membrane protein
MELLNDIKTLLEYTILDITIKKLLIFFGIIFVFFLFKQIFTKIVVNVLKKIASKTETSFDDSLIDIVEGPLRMLIIIIGFYIAFTTLKLPENASILIRHIINSLFIFAIFRGIYKAESLIEKGIENFFGKKDYELIINFLPFISKFLKITIVIFGAIFIVQEWGYNVGALITGLGIGGVAVALAAKDTLANLFGSIMILIDRPFKIGDWIIVNDIEGIVEDIGFRSTRIRTFGKALVSVPNSIVATTAITNWSMRDRRRINFSIGVTYSTSVEKLSKAVTEINSMLLNHPEIHDDPLMVYFTDFKASSLDIFIYCFAKTSDWAKYLEIKQDVNIKIMEVLENLNINFAFNSMSVYIEKTPENRI